MADVSCRQIFSPASPILRHWKTFKVFQLIFQKASYKSLYFNGCWMILFLNSKPGHATSTHMSAASSVLTGMNASACLPGIEEGRFPSPKALTDAHLPCSLSNTQGQTQPQCDEWDNNAVAWLPHMSYLTDLTYPTQSHVGCVTGPKSGMGLC